MAGGVLLSVLAAFLMVLIELGYVLLFRAPEFEYVSQGIWFVGVVCAVPLGVASVLGVVEGICVLGISTAGKRLAKQRLAEPKWMARIVTLITLPAVALVVAKAFAGRWVRQIPGKDFIALGVGFLGLALVYCSLRLVVFCRDRFRIRRWGFRHAIILISMLFFLTCLAYVVDQRVLVNLYPVFHIVLVLFAFVCCQLIVGITHLAWRRSLIWLGKVLDPKIMLMVALATIAFSSWGIIHAGQSEQMRYLISRHTCVQSKLLILFSGLGFGRAPNPLQTLAAPPAFEAEQLLKGPHNQDANLVLISVDALRADHMGIYGYERNTTPNLNRWAKKATVFERGYCSSPHTSFSVTSLLTGNYAFSIQGQRQTTIADVLRRYGYKTAGFFPPAVFYIDGHLFSAYQASMYGFEYVKYEFLDAAKRVKQILSFLDNYRGRKVFVWVHFFEPHEPYELHPPFDFGPSAVDKYDGEIAYVDHQIGLLINYLQKERPNTIVGLTGDHGEAFGEHDAHYHGNALYEEQIRVPVMISTPGGKERFVKGPVQNIDLPVTMLSIVDVPLPASMRGTNLGPWLVGEDPKALPPVFSEINNKKAAIHGSYKLIHDTTWDFSELYDLETDAIERKNMAAEKPKLVADLKQKLGSWMSSHKIRTRGLGNVDEVELLFEKGRRKDPGSIPGLAKLSRSASVEVRREAVRLLTLMRARSAKEVLVKATEDPDPGVWIQAKIGAAMFGDSKSLSVLPQLLWKNDLPPALRRDAQLTMALHGDGSATNELVRILDDSKDVYEQLEIVRALGKLGDPRAIPAIKRQMEHLRVHNVAIDALGRIGAQTVLPDLIKSLERDPYVNWRQHAARALGRVGDPRAVPVLQNAVRKELEVSVVAEALFALGKLGELHVPGVETTKIGPWQCNAEQCDTEIPVSCEEKRALLIVFETEKEKRFVSVSCGEKEIAQFDFSNEPKSPAEREAPAPATMVYLGKNGGRVRLSARGKPVQIRFLGLRTNTN
ncbi:MAG: sulfatase-like hydrolase/transferase [Pseudomonadota bacterium]